MRSLRYGASAAVGNGKMFVCGGETPSSAYPRGMEFLDPESGVWTLLKMPVPRICHLMLSYGNNLVLIGGDNVQVYSMVMDTIKLVQLVDMDKDEAYQLKFNRIFDAVEVEIEDLAENGLWKELPPMKQPRVYFTTKILGNDGEIFAIGGWKLSAEWKYVMARRGGMGPLHHQHDVTCPPLLFLNL